MSDKWIRFVESGRTEKTVIWDVRSIEGDFLLGQVKWFGRWRKYAFFVAASTVFEQQCLRDIADFCSEATILHQRLAENRRREAALDRAREIGKKLSEIAGYPPTRTQ